MSRRNGEEGIVRRLYSQKGDRKRRSDITKTPRMDHWCCDCFVCKEKKNLESDYSVFNSVCRLKKKKMCINSHRKTYIQYSKITLNCINIKQSTM